MSGRRWTARGLVALFLVTAGLTYWLIPTRADAAAGSMPAGNVRMRTYWLENHSDPCAQEDSRNCLWEADVRGNRLGRSFVDVNGRAHYLRRNATMRLIVRHLNDCVGDEDFNCAWRGQGRGRRKTLASFALGAHTFYVIVTPRHIRTDVYQTVTA